MKGKNILEIISQIGKYFEDYKPFDSILIPFYNELSELSE
jgi:hypothetical protein